MRGSTLIICGLLAGCHEPQQPIPSDGGFCQEWQGEYVGEVVRDVYDCQTGALYQRGAFPITVFIGGDGCAPTIDTGDCEVPIILTSENVGALGHFECGERLYYSGNAYLMDGELRLTSRVRVTNPNGTCEMVVSNFNGEIR